MDLQSFDPKNDDHMACLIAIHVRNSLEDLHVSVEGLTDDVMVDLNQRIRRAVYEVISGSTDDQMAWLVAMIPNYWEMPSELPAIA